MRNIYRAVMLLLCTLLLTGVAVLLSESVATAQVALEQSGQAETVEKSEKLHEWERQQEKAKNKQRQENLKKDTDKLLQLATDLKLAVDKSNEQTLSMDVIKKADEVEKLAKSIQRKMKGD